ncbi:MAG: AAA family ATPase [Gemmataceae bacterium]
MSQNKKVDKPNVYVIAGPNGSGKTTFAKEYLPKFAKCLEFLNADLIAAGLSPFAPERENVRAGRILLTRIRELSQAGIDFGFETTLAGRNHAKQLYRMKSLGYRIVLIFLWLPDANLAVNRVASRVLQGGHNIPEVDIRRRFDSGLRNFFDLYQALADDWLLFDASQITPQLIALELTCNIELVDIELYKIITSGR